MTKEIRCAECGVSGGHALYCLSCTEKFFIKGKEWVSLTDEEIEKLHIAWVLGGGFRQLCNAIEETIKEKNH